MPKKKHVPMVFSLVTQAWQFLRKQRVLLFILIWLLIVPLAIANLLDLLLPRESPFALATGMSIAILVLFLTSWGTAAILLVGRRMIQSRAGRARTSLKAVLREAVPYVLPFVATSILQGCFIFYRVLLFLLPAAAVLATPIFCDRDQSSCTLSWGLIVLLLPLLLPAIVYAVRTAFFPVALFTDDVRYRAALERSRAVTHGKFGQVFGTLLLLSLLFIALPSTIGMTSTLLADHAPLPQKALAVLFAAIVAEAGYMLFTLSLIPLYGKLRKTVGKEVKAPEIEPL